MYEGVSGEERNRVTMVRILSMAWSIIPSLSRFRSVATGGSPSHCAVLFAPCLQNSCRPLSLLHLGSGDIFSLI